VHLGDCLPSFLGFTTIEQREQLDMHLTLLYLFLFVHSLSPHSH
jgi:hypothetical protein